MNALPHYDPDDPYPESDGQPMAENTEQYEWLVKIKENLEILFAGDPNVFIAGDLFWYPVPERRISGPVAPDVMVVIGRPKGRRGSYKQWEEGGIAPQVVFEILSPANSAMEMADKLAFYDTFGVEEYYVYDPSPNTLEVWLRQEARLRRMSHLRGWTSPRLGIRFALTGETLEIFDPQGQPFLSSVELAQRARQAASLAEQATARADEADARAAEASARAAAAAAHAAQESIRAEQATVRAEQERDRAERLAERLRSLGIEP